MFDKLKAKKDAEQAQKEREKLDLARDEKCIPLAKQFLKLIADGDFSLKKQTDEEFLKEYNPITEQILNVLLENEVKISDLSYIKQLIGEILQNVDTLVTGSLNNSLRIAENALWGVDRDEKNLKHVDNVLKEWGAKQVEQK
jgi:hypothetical protein